MFPDKELVRGIQAELDQIIHAGVQNIVKLIHRTNRLDDAKDVAVTTSTTEKTAEVIAAVSEEPTVSNATRVRSIIGLEEELDVDTTTVPEKKVEKQEQKTTTPLTMNTHKVLHSYLNALKTQAETRGHGFDESEDLIKQLIAKGLLSQRSVDKLEKQLATFNTNEKKVYPKSNNKKGKRK